MTTLFRILVLLLLWLLPGTGFLRTVQAGMEVIAHRGAMMLAPENTLASQRLAYELGAEYVECDVRITSDLVPVNMHDWDVNRTTNGQGPIGGMTLEQLKQLDAGIRFSPRFAGERVPTLAEVIEVAKQYNRKLMLDIKGEFIAPYVVEVIRQSGIPQNQIAFLTWWDSMTVEYTSRLPGVKMLRPLAERAEITTDAALEHLRGQGVTTVLSGYGYVKKEDLDRFHAAGFEFSLLYHPHTSSFYYQDLGLDSFWTDYTDVSMNILNRTEDQWTNWTNMAGLAPDQNATWMDPDGDGMDNLTEYAMGTNPLEAGHFPLFSMPAPNTIGLTLNLRENWSQYLKVTAQNSWGGPWYDLPNSVINFVSPTRLEFRAPVGTRKEFFRMKIDLVK